jgi:hypothetical protein
MNKNIFKFSLPILLFSAAGIFIPQDAFSLGGGDSFNATASVSIAQAPAYSEVYINHSQSFKIINSSQVSQTVSCAVVSTGTGVNITSVKVIYSYDLASQISTAAATMTSGDLSTGLYFDAVINNIENNLGALYYKIIVDYVRDADAKVKESSWYVANNPKIIHSSITVISAIDRVFSPTSEIENLYLVRHSSYSLSQTTPAVEVEYYYDADSSNAVSGALALVGGLYEFENGSVIVPSGVSSLSYRIGVRYNNEIDRVKWYPETGYITAGVESSSSGVVGAAGGTVGLPHGDQHYGDTFVEASSGALGEDTHITITELPTANSLGKNVFVPTQDIRKLYKIELDKSYDKNFTFTFFAGDGKDYEVFYRSSEAGLWQKIEPAVKNNDGTYTIYWLNSKYQNLEPVNYFALRAKAVIRAIDNSVRPANRAFMPGGSVRFNNLRDGDSVTIYNLKGKLIRKLTPGQFVSFAEWDGRNDKGDFAESGTYIYQVKADGKIISGTLAFVR